MSHAWLPGSWVPWCALYRSGTQGTRGPRNTVWSYSGHYLLRYTLFTIYYLEHYLLQWGYCSHDGLSALSCTLPCSAILSCALAWKDHGVSVRGGNGYPTPANPTGTRLKWGGFGLKKNPRGCLSGRNKTHRVWRRRVWWWQTRTL